MCVLHTGEPQDATVRSDLLAIHAHARVCNPSDIKGKT
jgi:hypothetical protein